jgi:hypothetical protein
LAHAREVKGQKVDEFLFSDLGFGARRRKRLAVLDPIAGVVRIKILANVPATVAECLGVWAVIVDNGRASVALA